MIARDLSRDAERRLADLHQVVARSHRPSPALLGVYVSELRRTRTLSAAQLARLCFVLRRTVFAWEHNGGPTKRSVQLRLVRYARRKSGAQAPQPSDALIAAEIGRDLIASSVAARIREQCHPGSRPLLREVVSVVCERFGITRPQLRSRNRAQLLVDARSAVARVAIHHFQYRQKAVAKVLGRSQSAVSRMLVEQV